MIFTASGRRSVFVLDAAPQPMLEQTSNNTPDPAAMARQYSIFMQHIIGVLLPYFGRCTRDLDAAAAEVFETLESYGVRTRAEFIKASQIIALSMVSLETLAESISSDLLPPERLRYRGCANSLTRLATQCEKALERRLADDSPGKSAHEPASNQRAQT